ncbi:hypothetical protein B0O99DRAFT_695601 [Bisporella sp. PMI_857]|nr:hypothetical protein B0O99DRAFT_695601 [Bisporella sp. PMI_857]
MTEEAEPAYGHDAAVRAITSYYSFLEKLYFSPGILARPPPEGLPQRGVAIWGSTGGQIMDEDEVPDLIPANVDPDGPD